MNITIRVTSWKPTTTTNNTDSFPAFRAADLESPSRSAAFPVSHLGAFMQRRNAAGPLPPLRGFGNGMGRTHGKFVSFGGRLPEGSKVWEKHHQRIF